MTGRAAAPKLAMDLKKVLVLAVGFVFGKVVEVVIVLGVWVAVGLTEEGIVIFELAGAEAGLKGTVVEGFFTAPSAFPPLSASSLIRFTPAFVGLLVFVDVDFSPISLFSSPPTPLATLCHSSFSACVKT